MKGTLESKEILPPLEPVLGRRVALTTSSTDSDQILPEKKNPHRGYNALKLAVRTVLIATAVLTGGDVVQQNDQNSQLSPPALTLPYSDREPDHTDMVFPTASSTPTPETLTPSSTPSPRSGESSPPTPESTVVGPVLFADQFNNVRLVWGAEDGDFAAWLQAKIPGLPARTAWLVYDFLNQVGARFERGQDLMDYRSQLEAALYLAALANGDGDDSSRNNFEQAVINASTTNDHAFFRQFLRMYSDAMKGEGYFNPDLVDLVSSTAPQGLRDEAYQNFLNSANDS